MNWNSFWVKASSQFFRIFSSVDIRNLSSSESDYIIILISPVVGIEIMEIPTCRTDNDYILFSHTS